MLLSAAICFSSCSGDSVDELAQFGERMFLERDTQFGYPFEPNSDAHKIYASCWAESFQGYAAPERIERWLEQGVEFFEGLEDYKAFKSRGRSEDYAGLSILYLLIDPATRWLSVDESLTRGHQKDWSNCLNKDLSAEQISLLEQWAAQQGRKNIVEWTSGIPFK